MAMRAGLLSLFVVLGAGAVAAAPESGAGRYQFAPVLGGALKLDTATGEVWLCKGEADKLGCTPVRAAGAAAESDGDLARRIAALEARLAAVETARRTDALSSADEQALDRVTALTDQMMRRFFGLVRELKSDLEDEAL